MAHLYKKPTMLISMIMVAINMLGLSMTSSAKTTVGSYRLDSWSGSHGAFFAIDKCVLIADPYFIEVDVNDYKRLTQCADYDDMKAFAEGKITNFHIYTISLGNMTRTNMKAYRPPANLKQGNVWTIEYRDFLESLSGIERVLYYSSTRKVYTAYGKQIYPFGYNMRRFEHLTTVEKLISGDW